MALTLACRPNGQNLWGVLPPPKVQPLISLAIIFFGSPLWFTLPKLPYCVCFKQTLLQHWEVFKTISELFVLVPALLGLKGNLAMTLASRLSTEVCKNYYYLVSLFDKLYF